MDNEMFNKKLDELMETISSLPAGPHKQGLLDSAKETRARHLKGQELVQQMTETLDVLRVNIKYMIFDLEATKRENQDLRDMLGDGQQ
jgi:hypothetical protein